MLTELEKKILLFIGDYLRRHNGQSPKLSEIGDGCGIKSVGTVHRYVTSIKEKGFLEKARSGWRTLRSPNELPYKGVIAAGMPIEAVEQDETIDLTTLLIQPDCFLLKIKGDSMINSGILDGDLVVIKPSNTASNGQIVVALVDNQEASLKEFQKIEGGKSIKLIPHNDEMKAQIYAADRLQVQGILLGVVRTYHR
ncbi:MAG: transcriptional repressor LexA [Candidatus Thiodiazotropha lotti]|uniref:Transcriptional repressor LexA n=1 Tax=Candidatus Thiodiazotropha lotti TaxID=2792787 RepID=A0A9E4K5Y4_9GAMM|nr:transcriptional repressor LexA [Candidatus Thiodiazotropha lotti]ODC00394.1 repressor LexA [Candidatus Thiodiazotropha endoloripes]MCG7928804.1 transcriptional repressor LexA [Candidatus Thiodiazotropha lotti]MCG7939431.1 transcriptional repressor LexA [Candidatus Thiodiazotropha lotti]MCG7987318.1 transcriptional repressor LexA [Candidatus Thiodiazotropha lotti]